MHNAIGPNAIKPLADQIGRAKKYADAWAKYEKALADWRDGKKNAPPPEPEPEPEPEPGAEAEKVDPITGIWEAEIDIQGPASRSTSSST